MATKADIQQLEQRLIGLMDQRFDRVNDAIDRVRTVVVNLDKRLALELEDHEQRITRLERRVGIAA
ncbi:MAG: hypothetical protein EXS09_22505 [Gemmataceae bacterium]|nr:hypothetical protein [Gemmataceae bacterium]